MRGLVVGTGPSLRSVIGDIWRFDGLVFCCNNTPADLIDHGVPEQQIVWLACDEKWHEVFSPYMPEATFSKWHWDKQICQTHGYTFIPGVWHKGLWLKDKSRISLNHCSGAQLLNLAAHYGCREIVLIGHDFRYPKDQPRHYFSGLSETDGEYPQTIRKHSLFDKGPGNYDLIDVYREIKESIDANGGILRVVNCTPDSALPWFEFGDFENWLK